MQAQRTKNYCIPQSGHKDIMLVGMEQYFEAIKEFVSIKYGRGALA